MNKFFFTVFGIVAMYAIALGEDDRKVNSQMQSQAEQWIRNQPVKFLENKGQMSDDKGNPVPYVLFKASVPQMDMYVTEKGLTYLFFKTEEEEHEKKQNKESFEQEETEENIKIEWSRIDMDLKGANIRKENIIKETPSQTDYNYFYSHCPEGIYGVKQYEKITIKDVYPGIDWVLYNSTEKGFKYDFIVRPGADPAHIKLLYRSEKNLELDKEGNILIETLLGTLTENAPISYFQESGTEIPSSFTKKIIDKHSTEVTFQLSNFELSNSQTLVIDPQLAWGTFFGGNSADGILGIDCDINGNVYVIGYAGSTNFPAQAWGSAYLNGTMAGVADAYILRFSNAGNLDWATYYGGSSNEKGTSIATDAAGNIYVTGFTSSTNFPTQAWGSAYFDNVFGGLADVFILRFSSTGVRDWATYYGGSSSDFSYSIKLDASGNIYIAGNTNSANFPTQPWGSAYFDNVVVAHDVFILRFSNTGARDWATFYGGSGDEYCYSIKTNTSGDIYITGSTYSVDFFTQSWGSAYFDNAKGGTADVFIVRFDAAGALNWATFYGGNNVDYGFSLEIDVSGSVYVTGSTYSTDFPTQSWGSAYLDTVYGGQQDAFVLRFSTMGNRDWATYYGGSNLEAFGSYDNIASDTCGNIYISFETISTDIQTLNPGCGAYYDGTLGGGGTSKDVFLVKLGNIGQLLSATYIGADSGDFRSPVAIDANSNLYISGEWVKYQFGSSLPVMNPGGGAYFDTVPNGSDDSYIMKFIPILPTYTQLQVNPVCACNGSATINVSCATPPLNYTWSNSSQTLNTTNITNSIVNLCPGNYWVEVTDAVCNRDTFFFTLSGSSNLSTNTNGTNVACNGGSNGSASVTPSGGTLPYTYLWSPSGGTNATASGLSAGIHTITVTDANGCTSVQTATITQPAVITSSITVTSATCGNSDGSATVGANGGTGILTYNWSPSGGTSSTATGLSAGIYTITITDANGCTQTTSVVINNINGPSITFLSQTNVSCNGGSNGSTSVTLSGGTLPYTYLWSPSGGTNATASGLSGGIHTITVTDANGCISLQTTTITEPAALTSGQSASICSGSTYTLPGGTVVSTSGTYIDTLMSSTGCDSIINTTLTIVPAITSGQSASICFGSTYTLPGGTVVSTSGTYIDTLMSVTGCDSIINTTLTIVPAITSGQSVSICFGSTYTLPGGTIVSTSGTYNDTLTSVNGCDSIITTVLIVTSVLTSSQSVSICTGSTYTLPGGTVVSISGTYNDTLTAAAGCDSIITTTLTVNPASIASQSVSICSGSTYTLLGGNVVNTNGIYKDTLTSVNGCDSIITTTLTINPSPTVTISPNITITQGAATTLMANGGGNYQWSSGEVTQNIIVSPIQTTTYCVTITDNNSCTAATCVTVTVEPIDCSHAEELYLPNAFSPNSDGENDEFCLPAGQASLQGGLEDCIKELTITIYDRWGERVYKSTDVKFCWDGAYKKKMEGTAVFVYYMEATLTTGKKITKKGNVSLIR